MLDSFKTELNVIIEDYLYCNYNKWDDLSVDDGAEELTEKVMKRVMEEFENDLKLLAELKLKIRYNCIEHLIKVIDEHAKTS